MALVQAACKVLAITARPFAHFRHRQAQAALKSPFVPCLLLNFGWIGRPLHARAGGGRGVRAWLARYLRSF